MCSHVIILTFRTRNYQIFPWAKSRQNPEKITHSKHALKAKPKMTTGMDRELTIYEPMHVKNRWI